MHADALQPYERSLLTADPLGLHSEDGRVIALDVARWLAPVDAADETVLSRCSGPALDIGCGPGRFVGALVQRGIAALGVDIAETAVALTRSRGFPAVLRSVFAPVPGEGRWPTALLMDGNIGVGGDPYRLLQRVRGLLRPGGRLFVEADALADVDQSLNVRFRQGGQVVGPSFPWALVGLGPLHGYAARAGYGVEEVWSSGGRTFAALGR